MFAFYFIGLNTLGNRHSECLNLQPILYFIHYGQMFIHPEEAKIKIQPGNYHAAVHDICIF